MKKVLVIDTETTGLPVNMNRPYTDVANWPHMLSVAWITNFEPGIDYEIMNIDGFIIAPRPGVVNSPGAMAINGITPAIQKEKGLSIEFVLAKLAVKMDEADIIVAHNAIFDRNIIGAEFERAGFLLPEKKWICTKEDVGNLLELPPTAAQRKYRPEITYKQPRLDELYQFLFNTQVPGREQNHGALQDAQACWNCFWELHKRGVISI